MSKGISKGTLNLKFMQNAQRAKQLQEVDLDRAEVQDDGKWEVSQAVRDAWGLGEDKGSQLLDVHEASYLPFLFPDKGGVGSETDDSPTTSRKTCGRRVFNNHGKEVLQTTTEPTSLPAPSASEPPPTRTVIHKLTISGSRSLGHQSKRPKDTKTARQTIFESGGVGVDLRAQDREDAPTEFLKPAGVDDPKDTKPVMPDSTAPAPQGIMSSARQRKVKREREALVADSGEFSAKPKKRKKD